MATNLTVYNQNVICQDSLGDNVVHSDLWKPYVYSQCPNNDPTHTFVSSLILATVSNTVVNVTSDAQDTGGRYRNQQFEMAVPAGPSSGFPVASTKTFPYNVRIVTYELNPLADNVGDSFSIYVRSPGPVGTLLSAVSSGKVLHLSNTVITNIGKGMEVLLTNGVVSQRLGECLNIDYATQTATFEDDVTESFDVGTAVILRSPIAKNIQILNTNVIKFATTMPGNKLIKQGFVIELCYNNMTASPKTTHFRAEMLI